MCWSHHRTGQLTYVVHSSTSRILIRKYLNVVLLSGLMNSPPTLGVLKIKNMFLILNSTFLETCHFFANWAENISSIFCICQAFHFFLSVLYIRKGSKVNIQFRDICHAMGGRQPWLTLNFMISTTSNKCN